MTNSYYLITLFNLLTYTDLADTSSNLINKRFVSRILELNESFNGMQYCFIILTLKELYVKKSYEDMIDSSKYTNHIYIQLYGIVDEKIEKTNKFTLHEIENFQKNYHNTTSPIKHLSKIYKYRHCRDEHIGVNFFGDNTGNSVIVHIQIIPIVHFWHINK